MSDEVLTELVYETNAQVESRAAEAASDAIGLGFSGAIRALFPTTILNLGASLVEGFFS